MPRRRSDYGGNILRHGPLDMIKVKEPGSGKGGDAPAKKCPQCLALIHAGYTACPECGYVFPPKESNDKMTQTASSAGVISGQVDYTDYEVLDVYYCVHEKRGSTSSNRNGSAPNIPAMPAASSRNGGTNAPRSAARCRGARGKPFRWPTRGFWRLLRVSPLKRSRENVSSV